jgi:hypothetical protein
MNKQNQMNKPNHKNSFNLKSILLNLFINIKIKILLSNIKTQEERNKTKGNPK